MGRATTCPSCRRCFVNERALKAHMFHRASKCKEFISRICHAPQQELAMGSSTMQENLVEYLYRSYPTNQNDCHSDTTMEIEGEYVEKIRRPDGMTGIYCDSTFNFYQKIHDDDQNAAEREKNLFWPFSCFVEWEVVQFLESLGISQEKKDEFFRLKYVCRYGIEVTNLVTNLFSLKPGGTEAIFI
jgi:hypothetical protein